MKFKTRKDKIIEKQEERIKYLEQIVIDHNFKRPMVIEQQKEIVKIGCHQLLEDGMSVEYAKEIIARNMVNELKRFIEYDMEDGSSDKDHRPYPIITGYLNVAIR